MVPDSDGSEPAHARRDLAASRRCRDGTPHDPDARRPGRPPRDPAPVRGLRPRPRAGDRAAATAIAWQGCRDVVVDLRGATFLDCAGVGALARLQTIVEQRGGDFRLFE